MHLTPREFDKLLIYMLADDLADAQIAAICRTAEATLATRNTDDFSGTGIDLINPWKPDQPPA